MEVVQQYSSKFGEVISAGSFTDYELFLFFQQQVSILVARTSFTLENMDFYREETSPNPNQVFASLAYIQDRNLRFGKKYRKIGFYYFRSLRKIYSFCSIFWIFYFYMLRLLLNKHIFNFIILTFIQLLNNRVGYKI